MNGEKQCWVKQSLYHHHAIIVYEVAKFVNFIVILGSIYKDIAACRSEPVTLRTAALVANENIICIMF